MAKRGRPKQKLPEKKISMTTTIPAAATTKDVSLPVVPPCSNVASSEKKAVEINSDKSAIATKPMDLAKVASPPVASNAPIGGNSDSNTLISVNGSNLQDASRKI